MLRKVHGVNDESMEFLENVEKRLKRLIREWEDGWKSCFGKPPSLEVKKSKEAGAYHHYNKCKTMLQNLESFNGRFEELKSQLNEMENLSCYDSTVELQDCEQTLVQIGDEFKLMIKNWMDSFLSDPKRNVDSKSELTSDEKNTNIHWYKCYKICREKLKEIRSWRADMQKLVKETKSSLKKRDKEGGEGEDEDEDEGEGGIMLTRTKILKLKYAWKKHIRAWELNWKLTLGEGAIAKSSDKEKIKKWYLAYAGLSELELRLEKITLESMMRMD